MPIKHLSKETIKLINSTQVISSIYSAIKELVENSLDAAAQNIEVNLVDNGLSLIEVKDNGTGINREDAQFMALPAYTSKISDFNDLDLLSTYGFRGEGLNAVCQVSDVRICTKTVNDETMICYVLDNDGKVVTSELSHGLNGTTVQMKNLFKNMPVRRNILNNKRRINQEIKAIEILLKTYAICKPSIRFIFRVNSNTVFTKPSCKTIVEAIKSVLGIQLFSKLIHMKKDLQQTEIELFIPKKEIKDCNEISQSGYQFLCVNDRPIKSKEIEKKINKRVSEFFNSSNSRKFVFCLTLKVDPSMLDVNLEPNKDKVILQNEALVLNEIDNTLLHYYDLQDSQASTQNGIENINCNGNANENDNEKENEKAKDKEKEWPACKKRKIELQNENVSTVNTPSKLNQNNPNPENKVKKSDNEFLKSINQPALSDSDSNDAEEFMKKKLQKHDKSEMMDTLENRNSETFDFGEKQKIVEETLSQLPKVDLGEDFDWNEIINKKNTSTTSHSEMNETNNQNQETDISWSKGQVPGLQGGVTVGPDNNSNADRRQLKERQHESESFDFLQNVNKIDDSLEVIPMNDLPVVDEFNWDPNVKNMKRRTPTKRNSEKTPGSSKKSKKSALEDPTQTRIPFAGDNACLSYVGPSAFSMYCTKERSKILREHPELTPAEVAVQLNKQWKEVSPEEREYYRDLANQRMNESSISMTQSSSKKTVSKSQVTEDEKEKNRKQLVTMLGNMKMNKAEAKSESMIMRAYTTWSTSIPSIAQKCKKSKEKLERNIVGSLNSLLWIMNLTSKLFVFDISELHAQLDEKNYDISQINAEYVKNLVDQWFTEKNDMTIFHPLHPSER